MKRAFTLIEVLVVVAIIALLVSILLPSLARARDQANSARCLANMRDMSTGVTTFAQTHAGYFQLVTGGPAQPNPYNPLGPNADRNRRRYLYESELASPAPLLVWPAALLREAGVRSLKNNADWGIEGQAAAAAAQDQIPAFDQMRCPSDSIQFGTPGWPLAYYGYLSYGINEDIVGDRTDSITGPEPAWKDGNKGLTSGAGKRLLGQLDGIVRPQEVLMFVDAGSDKLLGSQTNVNHHLILSGGASRPHGPLLEYFEEAYGRLPYDRHRRGSLNVTYADGHGGWVKRQILTNPPPNTPSAAYEPKVRVSPYNSGPFPVP
jgi:prepilin-type N-terminal cleavage/methylation domain-containing protein/prepilin-type processing-associated H-X9-DG protein